ncbi:MAG: hypothetical protein P4L84_24690 [Isosphaeraceae bacterium]|nr:hypothetical protein [Isosphaeraceae bacterium]
MSGNPYSPSYYEPPAAELTELRPLEPPHAGLGIASFLIGLFVGIGEMAVVGWAGYIAVTKPNTMTPESPMAVILGLIMLGGMAVAFLGAGLGIGGLFQKDRKRVFAVLGLIINVMTMAAFVGLVALGLAVKQ